MKKLYFSKRFQKVDGPDGCISEERIKTTRSGEVLHRHLSYDYWHPIDREHDLCKKQHIVGNRTKPTGSKIKSDIRKEKDEKKQSQKSRSYFFKSL